MSIICSACGAENPDELNQCQECNHILNESAVLIHGKYKMTRPYIFSPFRAVYEAVDVQDNKKYSIREFLPHLSGQGQKILIKSGFEALMAKYSKLSHKNLAGIVDYFIEAITALFMNTSTGLT